MDGSDYPQTKKYRPSNGTEGDIFEDRFCNRCKREAKFRRTEDGSDGCSILMKVMAYAVDDPKYPAEWIVNLHDPYGSTARCTAFRHEDDPGPRRPRKPRPAPLLDLIA